MAIDWVSDGSVVDLVFFGITFRLKVTFFILRNRLLKSQFLGGASFAVFVKECYFCV